MVSPFLNKGTTEIITFDSNISSLYEAIDREILPNEYGGTSGPYENTPSASAVYQMLDYFVQIKKYVYQ